MSSIGTRLKEERERIALSQTTMAEAVGSTRKSQFNYETDSRHPDALYLAALDGIGVDVLYVVTGRRSQASAASGALEPDEQALLDGYRRCSADGRRHVLQTASLLSQHAPPTKAAAAKTQTDKSARGRSTGQ